MNNEKKDSQNPNVAAAIFSITAPAFCYFHIKFAEFAANPKVWMKVRRSKARNPFIAGFLLIFVIVSNLLMLRSVFEHNYKLALLFVILNYIAQHPLANLYLLHKMNELVGQNKKGLVDPRISSAIKQAKLIHGAEYAEYLSLTDKTINVKNQIGKRIEPFDEPIPLFSEPKVTEREVAQVVVDGNAVFPLNTKSPDHHLVIGQTGSGKTTLIKQMVKAGLEDGWKVVVIDLKGDPTDVSKFLEIEANPANVIHFPTSGFDFWKGTSHELAERIISFFPTDSEPFYLNRNSFAIHAVISRSGLPNPKSVEELVDRLRNGIKNVNSNADVQFFGKKERGVFVGELVANDIASYLDPIRNIERTNPYRFHWNDNWNLALFTLDGFEMGALKMADAILHDFASWIFSDERTANKTPILLIIDEASAFSALQRVPILSSLLQRARSAKVSLVYASQNLSAFKDEKDNILHSGSIKWLGNSTEVNEMVESAGTRSVIESGFQIENDDYTGIVTHRVQKEFKIDPDFVRELKTFHWFVSSRGKVSNLFVPPIDWQDRT